MIILGSLLILCVLLLIGVSVPLAFGGVLVFIGVFGGHDVTGFLPTGHWKMNSIVLLAIPLFILAGAIMERGRIAAPLVSVAELLVGRIHGGLSAAAVFASGIFGSISGSAAATLTCIGSIMMPQMLNKGYSAPFTVALAAAAGLLEALIPPSNAAIIYSGLTGVPVSDTFAAGVMPGLALLFILILVVIVRCWHMEREVRATLQQRMSAFRQALPGLLTPVIILGGIYSGLLTPSETAAVAAVWAIFLGFVVHRELSIGGLWQSLQGTAITTSVIFSIIAMATFLSVVLTYTQAPQKLTTFFVEFGVTPIMFLFVVGAICLILGTFVEIVPVFYLTVPVFMAVAMTLDIPLTHLYIVFTAFAGLGLLTPPVCVGLYTASSVINLSADRAFGNALMFVGVGIVYAVLMILLPGLATWLPEALR